MNYLLLRCKCDKIFDSIEELKTQENRAKFFTVHYESLPSKVYRRDTRDSSPQIYLQEPNLVPRIYLRHTLITKPNEQRKTKGRATNSLWGRDWPEPVEQTPSLLLSKTFGELVLRKSTKLRNNNKSRELVTFSLHSQYF